MTTEAMTTDRPFEDRVALVTGGSSGIGRATALAFARAGARVVIASRGTERGETVLDELEELGAEARFFPTDVASAEQVERLVAQTVGAFGRLDYAVNNAGTTEIASFQPTAEIAEEDFDRALALNLKSVWLCLKHELRQMLGQDDGGAIVNTSSVNGLGGTPQNTPYAMAKAGILALTKSAALEVAGQGVRINALVPGAFRTPMLVGGFERISPDNPEAVEKRYASQVPVGRIGRPEEAAEAVLWLCSDAASYVTGHSLIVDGGLTAPYR